MKAGTRESELAMRQTEMFREYLGDIRPDVDVEIIGIASAGDRDKATPLKDMGGAGVFVRELDEALLDGRIDVSVNSLKDIPVRMDPRLTIGAVMPRDDPRDCMVPMALEDAACGVIVGTSSVRRQLLLRTVNPKLRIKDIRGNVRTRLDKVHSGEVHAVIVSTAGLQRLGLDADAHPIEKRKLVPAAGQGAIAIECRADDAETLKILREIDDGKTRAEVSAEREVLRLMDAGCSSPVGVNAEVNGKKMRMVGVSFDYTPTPVRVDETFPLSEVGERVPAIAEKLLGKG